MDNSQTPINLDEFSSPTGWEILATEARLESIHYPTFDEPSHLVVFTLSFKRHVFYEPLSGILWKVKSKNSTASD